MVPENRMLVLLLLIGGAVVGAYLFLGRALALDLRPGAPIGQVAGILAGLLVCLAAGHSIAKKTHAPPAPNRSLQTAHTIIGLVVLSLAVMHSRASVRRLPALLLLAMVGVFLSGAYGRLVGPRRWGLAFGRGGLPFRPVGRRERQLTEIRDRKANLLCILAPTGREATFTLGLGDWFSRPLLGFRYFALSALERRAVRRCPAGGWESVAQWERYWRILHLVLAALVVLGLLLHVVTTVFFAQYAAGGGDVYWWHLRR